MSSNKTAHLYDRLNEQKAINKQLLKRMGQMQAEITRLNYHIVSQMLGDSELISAFAKRMLQINDEAVQSFKKEVNEMFTSASGIDIDALFSCLSTAEIAELEKDHPEEVLAMQTALLRKWYAGEKQSKQPASTETHA